ncbi:MAG: hypothetical protein AMJ92_05835 [candidate division Zixibacteria bacterium SM23_81]|nr:MAG: hypothetical protein AMJ92_05835 [candidate division Zixibacteria bacterium SM23_81]
MGALLRRCVFLLENDMGFLHCRTEISDEDLILCSEDEFPQLRMRFDLTSNRPPYCSFMLIPFL